MARATIPVLIQRKFVRGWLFSRIVRTSLATDTKSYSQVSRARSGRVENGIVTNQFFVTGELWFQSKVSAHFSGSTSASNLTFETERILSQLSGIG